MGASTEYQWCGQLCWPLVGGISRPALCCLEGRQQRSRNLLVVSVTSTTPTTTTTTTTTTKTTARANERRLFWIDRRAPQHVQQAQRRSRRARRSASELVGRSGEECAELGEWLPYREGQGWQRLLLPS